MFESFNVPGLYIAVQVVISDLPINIHDWSSRSAEYFSARRIHLIFIIMGLYLDYFNKSIYSKVEFICIVLVLFDVFIFKLSSITSNKPFFFAKNKALSEDS